MIVQPQTKTERITLNTSSHKANLESYNILQAGESHGGDAPRYQKIACKEVNLQDVKYIIS